MDTRHLVAYALIFGLIVAPILIAMFLRRARRRDKREAERPIRISRGKRSRD
jgi:hypothetical protein